jgi:two-component system sensor histidine kinase PilS (NtrC family)
LDSSSAGTIDVARSQELRRFLVWLVLLRAVVLLLGLNLAQPLGVLPSHIGRFAVLPLTNTLIAIITTIYLPLWWADRFLLSQLYAQIGTDLALVTLLVAYTGGMESAFLSFYILIIIYSGLALGRNGGLVGASWSVLLYAGIIIIGKMGLLNLGGFYPEYGQITFRIFFHALGFFAVAFLGNYLLERVRVVEKELQARTDSLRQLQSLNDRIISSIRSGLMTIDLGGRVALFNRTAEDLLGRKSTYVLEKPLSGVISSALWDKITGYDLAQNIQPLRHEEWIKLPSGSRKYLGFSVSPLEDEKQSLLGYIISFQDLTEITRLEEEVRLKDRMAAIGNMAAGVAHEIRNPLTAMQGSIEVLRSRSGLPKSDEKLLEIVTREGERLNRFVEDFLHLARPDKSMHGDVDLVTLIRDSITLLQNSPGAKDKYDIVFQQHAPKLPILGNANQLRQVFWNLSQNAFRAMPSGGTLTIAAQNTDEGGTKIAFQDTGIGMSQEERDRLFQPFQSGFAKGTGLGLSIVFQIMADHGGKISVDSEKGRGTGVILYFPPVPNHPRAYNSEILQ